MDRKTFLDKVGEGLVVGIMVALVVTVSGIVWKGFEEAKNELARASDILDTQVHGTNQAFNQFNKEQAERNWQQDLFNEKQVETNLNLLRSIEGMQEVVAELSKSSKIKYQPVSDRRALQEIETGLRAIQKDLTDKRLIQENTRERVDIYQQEQMQQQQR